MRLGDQVLRPIRPHTASVHQLLTALRGAGFAGAPLPLGVAADGREVLSFVEGDVAVPPYPAWAQADEALASLARLTRRFHDASARVGLTELSWSGEMADPNGGTVVCHNDICLENVVFHEAQAFGLLDFDFAAPGDPIRDLAAMARMCVPVDDPTSAAELGWSMADRPARARLAADSYGLSAAQRLRFLTYLDDAIARGGQWVLRQVQAGDPNFTKMWDDMGGMARFDRRRMWWQGIWSIFAEALK